MRSRDSVVVIRNKTGERIEGVACTVTPDTTVIEGTSIIVEPGDLLVRSMSNGAEETYEVLEPQFYEEKGGTYIIEQKKLGLPEAEKALQNITYNVSGNNARINNNSVDNSSNQIIINSDLSEKIQNLKTEVLQHTQGQEQKDALEVVDAVEQQLNSGSPSRVIVSTLLKGLPTVGNVASIASLIVALLV